MVRHQFKINSRRGCLKNPLSRALFCHSYSRLERASGSADFWGNASRGVILEIPPRTCGGSRGVVQKLPPRTCERGWWRFPGSYPETPPQDVRAGAGHFDFAPVAKNNIYGPTRGIPSRAAAKQTLDPHGASPADQQQSSSNPPFCSSLGSVLSRVPSSKIFWLSVRCYAPSICLDVPPFHYELKW